MEKFVIDTINTVIRRGIPCKLDRGTGARRMFYGLNKPDLVPLRVFGLKRSHNESACGTFQGNESETSESSNMLF